MLILSRKEGETILIYPSLDVDPSMTIEELFQDGPIRLMLGDISGNRAKIGIEAPATLEIARSELVNA